MSTPKLALAERIISELLQAKSRLEDEKYSNLQGYVESNQVGELSVQEIGIRMPVVTEHGLIYQTQYMPLLSLFPCQFFKLESLNLSFNAYLKSDDESSIPELTLEKKNGWFHSNQPVCVSLNLSEKNGPSVAVEAIAH